MKPSSSLVVVLALASGCQSKSDKPVTPPVDPSPIVAGDAAPGGRALVFAGCTPATAMPRLQTEPDDDAAAKMIKAPDPIPDAPPGKDDFAPNFKIQAKPQKAGRTKVASVTVDGKLPLEAARRVILQNVARLDVCYGQRLVAKPTLGGKGGILLVVDPNGAVLDAKAQAPDKERGECLSKAVRPWQFPQAGAGLARITVQLEFTPPKVAAGSGSGSGSPPPPDDTAKRPPPPPPTSKILAQWTPFATTPAREIVGLAEKARAVIEPKLGQMQLCAPATGDGTIRAMVRIDPRGTVRGVRTGGFGDAKAETCVGAALNQLETGKPPSQYIDDVELACDFTVGVPAKQFRVTPAAGYTIWQPGMPLATNMTPDVVMLVEVTATTTFEQLQPVFTDVIAPAILVAVDGVLVASAGGSNERALGKDVDAIVTLQPDGIAKPCGVADLAQPSVWSIHGMFGGTGAHLAALAGKLARLSRLTNLQSHCR